MATDSSFDPRHWADAMQKAQGNIMQQWSQFQGLWSQVASNAGAGAQSATAGGKEFAQQLASQIEQYVGISRSLWELLGSAATQKSAEERLRVFNEGLAGLQKTFMAGGAMAGAVPGSGNAMSWLFAGPALGPAREQQESLQRMSAAAARCAQAQARLATQWNEILSAGLHDLGNRLSPGLQLGQQPGSMKEVYDSWIGSAEKAYASAANNATFIHAQAEFANALSELKLAQREMVEEWARQFNLPTRAELDSLHRQVHELTAAVRRLGG
jgi:class III poly(R)-hydroxyalkanoic acid synthase PhaE subunit